MPTVGRYQPRAQTRALPAPGPGPAPTARDLGAGLLEPVAEGAAKIESIRQDELRKQRDLRLLDAQAKLGELTLGIQGAVGQVRGQDALKRNLEQEGLAELEKGASSILAELPDDEEYRVGFRKALLGEQASLRGAIAGHYAREIERVRDDTRKAAVTVALKKAEVAGGNPLEFQKAIAEGLSALETGGEPAEADKVAFLDAVEKLGRDSAARQKVDEILAFTDDPEKRRALVEEVSDTKLRDAVSERLERRLVVDKQAKGEAEKQNLGTLRQLLADTDGRANLKDRPEFAALTEDGRADILEKQVGYERARRSDAAEARRQADYRDMLFQRAFNRLSPEQQAKVDVRTGLMPDGTRVIPGQFVGGASEAAFMDTEADQGKVGRALDKGQRVQMEEFNAYLKNTVAGIEAEGKRTAVESRVKRWYLDRLAKDDLPKPAEVNEELAQAMLLRDPGRFSRNLASAQMTDEQIKNYPAAPPEKQPTPETQALARRLLGLEPAAPAAPAAEPAKPAAPAPKEKPVTIGDVPKGVREQIRQAIEWRKVDKSTLARRTGKDGKPVKATDGDILARYKLALQVQGKAAK